ncbi:hypothetical protein [uncultured Clostridium sp.]|uniref:hypothetical protein n=1 Tax=uncultured Clostridium sp. TaxID=59620 RepID=UPI0025CCE329|nr:hypothetical protein [uncultured Clostridium sp.]
MKNKNLNALLAFIGITVLGIISFYFFSMKNFSSFLCKPILFITFVIAIIGYILAMMNKEYK